MTDRTRGPRWRRHAWIWVALGAGAALAGIVVVVLILLLGSRQTGFPGGLRIAAGNDVRLFVGDLPEGSGSVLLPWSRLLGEGDDGPGHRPPPDFWLPVGAPELRGADEVARWLLRTLDDPDPLLLAARQVGGGYGGRLGRSILAVGSWEVLIRRSDGSLDPLFVLAGTLIDARGRTRRFLVPIRARDPSDRRRLYALRDHGMTVWSSNPFGFGPYHATLEWGLLPTPAPPEYRSLIEAAPLHQPEPSG